MNVIFEVTPFVGVWIETLDFCNFSIHVLVTPFVGVWIETTKRALRDNLECVTPFVGVWIETSDKKHLTAMQYKSHPSWVCGLKQ